MPAALSARKQRFRRHDDERHRDRRARLQSQQVIVVARDRRRRDAQVAFGDELQETLGTRARVFRTAAFVAVRQQQRQARGLAPLRLTGRDELIDDDLGAVEEIAVLRFPQHERVRLLGRVAVLESHAGVFRERAVADLEGGLLLGERCCSGIQIAHCRRRISGRPRGDG